MLESCCPSEKSTDMPRKGKKVPLPDVTLKDLLWESCLQRGERVAIIDSHEGGKSITFKEIYDLSRNCAAFLHNKGTKPGDFIGICAPSSIEYCIAMLGITGSGATLTHCNAAFKEAEMMQQLTSSKPKLMIVHEAVIETMKKVREKLPCLEAIFVIGRSDEFTTFDTMCKTSGDMSFVKEMKINPAEDLAVVQYSSGTTGLPKAVMRTHRNMVGAIHGFAVSTNWSAKDNSIMYMDRPMYHGSGFVTVLSCLCEGVTLIMEKEFIVEKMLKTIEKYKVTHAITVPASMIDLANAENTEKYDTSSLVAILGGGAAMAPSIRRIFEEKFNVILVPGYGMAESGVVTVGDNVRNDFFSVGKVCPNSEMMIIDLETSEECPDNKDGEVLVRGLQVMKGYLNNPEANANIFAKDGWMHTGDIGHFDEEGRLYIVDRLKELIKYRSLQVPPAQLEAALLKHPKIADVGVIGIPHPTDGEHPKAFVVRKDESLTEQEVDEFAKSQLVDYKQLRGGVEFVQAIPKSLTGKIQRNELKKMAMINA